MRATVLVLIASLAALGRLHPGKAAELRNARGRGAGAGRGGEVRWTTAHCSSCSARTPKPLIDSGDPVADKNARERFVRNYKAANSLDKSVADTATLEVGEDKWPFPIPVVLENGKLALRQRDRRRGTDQSPRRRQRARDHPVLPGLRRCAARVLHAQRAARSAAALRRASSSAPTARRTASTGRPAVTKTRARLARSSRARAPKDICRKASPRRARRTTATSTGCSPGRVRTRPAAPTTTSSTASC